VLKKIQLQHPHCKHAPLKLKDIFFKTSLTLLTTKQIVSSKKGVPSKKSESLLENIRAITRNPIFSFISAMMK